MTKTADEILIEKKADIEHAKQVEEYCIKLFDALSGLNKDFNFSEREKLYLTEAAKLHDIGYFIDKKSHHKHTLQMITEEGIFGFDERENLIIGNIARYHRGSEPDEEKHEYYSKLENTDKILVSKLASILRIADGLDKPHKNLILRMRAEIDGNSIKIYLKSIGFKPVLKMAEKKKELFETVYKKNIDFVIE